MYQAIARKYRPQTWADVIGQQHVSRTISNAIVQSRLHHAYLFCGARGVGKTTVARILAKALNCPERGNSAEPCNICVSCLNITSGSSLDVQEIDGASNTSVDDVRELREGIKYLPTGDRYKVIIIDEVHMLSKAAFNALLKTLEEPPAHVIFVFATTEPHKIPITILSRCQRYDFRRVSVLDIVNSLQVIAKNEQIEIGEDVLHMLAFEAEGGLRDAQSLLDQAIAFAGKRVTADDVRSLLGLTDRSLLIDLVRGICARDASATLALLENIFQSGGNLARLAQELLETMRHLWVIASCGELPNPGALPAEEAESLQKIASGVDVTQLQQWFALLYRGLDEIVRGRFPKLAFESVLLNMVQVSPMLPIDDLISRVESLMANENGAALASAPVAISKTAPAAVAAPKTWESFLVKLRSERPQMVSILQQAEVSDFTGSAIVFKYPKNSLYADMLREPERSEQLKTMLSSFFGNKFNFKVLEQDGPTMTEQNAEKRQDKIEKNRAAHEAALSHAMVQEANKLLGAEIKEVKILKS